jgi:hypothetical protein
VRVDVNLSEKVMKDMRLLLGCRRNDPPYKTLSVPTFPDFQPVSLD